MKKQLNWPSLIPSQVGECVMIWGSSGGGKTSYINTLAQAMTMKFMPRLLQNLSPEDIGGYPMLGKVTVYDIDLKAEREVEAMKFVLDEARVRAEYEPTIVLFDELPHADRAIQGAAQEWIRKPGKHCWMFATGNPIEISTTGTTLGIPVVNRMVLTHWTNPWDDVLNDWENDTGESEEIVYTTPDVPIVKPSWFGGRPKWTALVADFLRRKSQHRETTPEEDKPFCSQRSWQTVAKCLAAGETVEANRDTQMEMVQGCIPVGVAEEFFFHLDTKALPSPEEILADPQLLEFTGSFPLDRGILGGIIAAVEHNLTTERWDSLKEVLSRVGELNKELGMAMMGRVNRLRPSGHVEKEDDDNIQELQRIQMEMLKATS